MSSRKSFLRQLTGSAALLAMGQPASLLAAGRYERKILQISPTDRSADELRIGVIGAGIMGYYDVETALKVPGIQLVAACDLYKGRLERMKEVHGKGLFTTMDYRELLQRKDIDAVIIATADYWHAPIALAALEAGKHIYCEKPMVHRLEQGLPVIKAHQQSGKLMQIGSQGISGIDYAKAKALYKAGEIGQLNCIEATYDRQSALGAWEYTMPTDAAPETVDWDAYVRGMQPKPGYDEKKFFWWRNYKEFGTGVSGDLFVHLLTGIHYTLDSKGPERIYASGQLSYWKDGRNVPDVMTAIMDYPATETHPAFQLTLRVNFVSGGGEQSAVRFIGSEGIMEKTWTGVRVIKHRMSKAPGIGGWDALVTYPEAMQQQLMKQYRERWSEADQQAPTLPGIEFNVPEGYDSREEHFKNFFAGIRDGEPLIEDPVTGFRAAAPCLAANESYFSKKQIYWDPEKMQLKKNG